MYDLIGDFIRNGVQASKNEAQKLSAEILKQLQEKKILQISSIYSHTAQKLEERVCLQEIELIKEGEVLNGYDDAFRG